MTRFKTALSPADLPSQDEMLSISGLEFMQKMLHGEIARPPISEGLNYHPHLVEDGRVVFRGRPEFRHTNPMGTVHGGWYGTLLDSCMACAVMTRVPRGATLRTAGSTPPAPPPA
jgi:acyl-coenzyme A thioesterase PaaI-like protein